MAGILLPRKMRVQTRDKEGNPKVWAATFYTTDEELKDRIEQYEDENDVSESKAMERLMKEGQQ